MEIHETVVRDDSTGREIWRYHDDLKQVRVGNQFFVEQRGYVVQRVQVEDGVRAIYLTGLPSDGVMVD